MTPRANAPKVLVTRPQPQADDLAARLSALGYAPICAPLTKIARQERLAPAEARLFQSFIFTSANGVRAFAQDVPAPAQATAYCVGAQTAQAAREVGFAKVVSSDGDAEALAAQLIQHHELKEPALWARGANISANLQGLLGAGGVDIHQKTLYAAQAVAAPPAILVEALEEKSLAAALFLSARASEIFANFAHDADLTLCAAICISARAAAPLSELEFGRVDAAPSPNLQSVVKTLKLVRKAPSGETGC